jgi:hypothetical protein
MPKTTSPSVFRSAFDSGVEGRSGVEDRKTMEEAELAALAAVEVLNRDRLGMEVEDVNMNVFPAKTLADYPVSERLCKCDMLI